MLWFYTVKKFFKKINNPSLEWNFCQKFPALFFFPHMKFNEYYLFKKISRNKKVVLEFGSGGSTINFLKAKKKVYSVESNPKFYKYMKSIRLINEAINKSLVLKFIELGETDQWGSPVLIKSNANVISYYSEIWKDINLNKQNVDLIYIDGRFRVCSCIYSILQLLKNDRTGTTIMIHDFWNRKEYHILLKFLTEIKSKSRLGCFIIKKEIDIKEAEDVLNEYSASSQ